MATHESAAAVRRRDGVAVIDLAGDINASAQEALDAAWEQATAQRPDAVVLNFDGASYINSTGIALIVGLLAKARAGGLELRAYGLTPHYREIFEITRLADFMAIAADETGALAPPQTNEQGGNHA
jgi:anti-anti-sigma factor